MHLTHLSVVDFRSYATAELPLSSGVTALVGPNGHGKTNLVEAIGYLGTMTSHRVPSDGALVRHGASQAVVRGQVARNNRSTLIEIEINPGKANRARINRSPVPRAREVLGVVRTVLFAPEDLALVKGDPEGRRRFLDDLLVLLSPRMAAVRADYDRVQRQRGALLKSAGALRRTGRSADLRTLDIWDEKLAEVGGQLLAARLRLVQALQPYVAQAYEQVSSGQGEALISYRSSLAEAEAGTDGEVGDAAAMPAGDELPGAQLLAAQLVEAMSRLRSKELDRGVCLVGPHRDDLILQLGQLPARGYASHGESWSYALALRLAAFRLLSADSADGEPILILDDVFAELDVRRRQRLAQLVASAEQVIITAAVADDVPEELAGARVDVFEGQVSRVR